jgi:imidazolonepropionase
MMREGVTTIEIKSGYGLDLITDRKMLRAARRLGELYPVRVITTFLGLHALPDEYKGRSDAFVDAVIREALPALVAEGLADQVDAYVEPIAFSADQAERFFGAAGRYGLPIKVHAEQLSRSGGAQLAAAVGALSADHLEFADRGDAAALAKAGVVAVLLPGAYLTLRQTRPPPVSTFRDQGVAMAVATDCNPGTSPLTSLLTAMNLACTLFGLTPAEALQGTTRNAARALGLGHRVGTVEAGKDADLAIWDVGHPCELAYWIGQSNLHSRYFGGAEIFATRPGRCR